MTKSAWSSQPLTIVINKNAGIDDNDKRWWNRWKLTIKLAKGALSRWLKQNDERDLLISSSDHRQLLLDPGKLSLQLRHPFAWPDHHHDGDDDDDDDEEEEENDDDLLSIIAKFSTSWMEILFFLFITPLRMSSTFTFKVWGSWSWDDEYDEVDGDPQRYLWWGWGRQNSLILVKMMMKTDL